MPKLPSGTGQLNIAGLRNDIIDEFRRLQEIPGPVKRKRKTWEVFEMIWKEWQQFKGLEDPQKNIPPEVLENIHRLLREHEKKMATPQPRISVHRGMAKRVRQGRAKGSMLSEKGEVPRSGEGTHGR